MLYEKKKLLIYRLVFGVLFVISLFIGGGIVGLAFFIASLLLSCREYYYNGNDIVVYAGWFHHYIKVNGIKYDEHNTLVSYVAIPLSCTLDDGTDVKVCITLTYRISLKINNRLYTKTKKDDFNLPNTEAKPKELNEPEKNLQENFFD